MLLCLLFQLSPNTSHLKLTEGGFEVKSLFKPHFTRWSAIEVFGVGHIGNRTAVVFNYSENHTKHQLEKNGQMENKLRNWKRV